MTNLYGKDIKKEDIARYVGSMSQVMDAREFAYRNGRQEGVKAIEVYNDTGFRFTILPDKGMDIGPASFCGKSLTWNCKNGVVAPQYYENGGLGFLRSFGGGLLTTCGLTSVGDPGVDGETVLGIHDRIDNLPAGRYSIEEYWEDGNMVIHIKGRVSQSCLYYENMVLERDIIFKMGEAKVYVHDRIINAGYNDTPFMLIYHINFGFPVITEATRFYSAAKKSWPWNEDAKKGDGKADTFQQPTRQYAYECFAHDMPEESDAVYAALINEDIAYGGYLKYSSRELPKFITWKMMGEQDYVVAMEPGTNLPEGRQTAKENGRLRILRAGEEHNVHLEIGVLSGKEQISNLKNKINA